MARRETRPVVTAEGRDKGKVFVLKEMQASKAAWWSDRFVLACARANLNIPENLAGAGMYAVFVVGFRMISGMSWDDAKILLDEMMTCVQIQPNPNDEQIVRPLVESDIEEVATFYFLRAQIFELHTGFSLADAISKWVEEKVPAGATSQTSPTSPA